MPTTTSYPKEKINVLLLENIHKKAKAHFQQAGYINTKILSNALAENELINYIQQNNIRILGIRSKTQITEKVLQACPNLHAIGCYCIGTNQVNLKVATKNAIAVFNSPYSNTRSVAELVIAQTILLLRRIPEKDSRIKKGLWWKEAAGSYEVRGKTIGIVGYGHIGSQVAILAEAMGMQVIYYDIVPKLPLGNSTAVSSLQELLTKADVVSLHVPATPDTQNLIHAGNLAQMKKNSILINLSRGSVVNIEDLAASIHNGHIAGAGIDVYPKEPAKKGDTFKTALQNFENVILTPHIGGSTQEAQRNIAIDASQKLVNFLDKGVTIGSHSIPELNLPNQQKALRLLHLHKNVPGVLSELVGIIAATNANIVGQYLNTNQHIGYAVIDIEPDKAKAYDLQKQLNNVPHTIRHTRMLYAI